MSNADITAVLGHPNQDFTKKLTNNTYSIWAYTLHCVCKTTKLGVYRLKFGSEQNPGKKDCYSLLDVVAVLPGKVL